jgi:hypothetical protein
MKIIRNIYLLIAFTLITQANTSFSMNIAIVIAKGAISGLCSTAELFLTSAPLLHTTILNTADLQKQKLESVKSDASEPIMHFATNLAQSRGISDVRVVLSDAHDYGTNDNANIIEIPRKEAEELERLLIKPTLTSEEKEEMNEKIGTWHHELTHCHMRSLKYVPMYDAAIGTLGAVTTSAGLTHLAYKYLPSIKNNFILHNAFKLGRGAVTLSLACKLMNMNLYKKYDELKADDGIPNQKDLLVAQMKRHEQRHDIHLHWVDVIKERASFGDIISPPEGNDFPRSQLLAMKTIPKSLFNKPLVMDAVFHANTEHPSDLRRANRFKDRIAKL